MHGGIFQSFWSLEQQGTGLSKASGWFHPLRTRHFPNTVSCFKDVTMRCNECFLLTLYLSIVSISCRTGSFDTFEAHFNHNWCNMCATGAAPCPLQWVCEEENDEQVAAAKVVREAPVQVRVWISQSSQTASGSNSKQYQAMVSEWCLNDTNKLKNKLKNNAQTLKPAIVSRREKQSGERGREREREHAFYPQSNQVCKSFPPSCLFVLKLWRLERIHLPFHQLDYTFLSVVSSCCRTRQGTSTCTVNWYVHKLDSSAVLLWNAPRLLKHGALAHQQLQLGHAPCSWACSQAWVIDFETSSSRNLSQTWVMSVVFAWRNKVDARWGSACSEWTPLPANECGCVSVITNAYTFCSRQHKMECWSASSA